VAHAGDIHGISVFGVSKLRKIRLGYWRVRLALDLAKQKKLTPQQKLELRAKWKPPVEEWLGGILVGA
jgi:hypothetical protein